MNSVLSMFGRAGQELTEDDLIEKLSAESLQQLNEALLMKLVIRTRVQIGNEIKTVYRRSNK